MASQAMTTNPTKIVSSTPHTDQGFRAFAPEIREMIFEIDLAGMWNGKTPPLIKALRGSKIYLEATEVFCKTNIFKLHGGNKWSFGRMPQAVINTVSNLEIESLGHTEAYKIRKLFRKDEVWKLNHVKTLGLQFPRTYEPYQVLARFSREHWDEAWEAACGRSHQIYITCKKIVTGICHSKALCRGLSNLKIFTAGIPGCLRVWRATEIDWGFHILGICVVEHFNQAVTRPHAAVLARVSSSNRQEWIWRGSGEGLFRRDPRYTTDEDDDDDDESLDIASSDDDSSSSGGASDGLDGHDSGGGTEG